MKKPTFDISKHYLVPEHNKLKDKEKKELLERYHIGVRDLPKISIKDPAIRELDAKAGDIIRIIRRSQTAGTTEYYRGVVN